MRNGKREGTCKSRVYDQWFDCCILLTSRWKHTHGVGYLACVRSLVYTLFTKNTISFHLPVGFHYLRATITYRYRFRTQTHDIAMASQFFFPPEASCKRVCGGRVDARECLLNDVLIYDTFNENRTKHTHDALRSDMHVERLWFIGAGILGGRRSGARGARRKRTERNEQYEGVIDS